MNRNPELFITPEIDVSPLQSLARMIAAAAQMDITPEEVDSEGNASDDLENSAVFLPRITISRRERADEDDDIVSGSSPPVVGVDLPSCPICTISFNYGSREEIECSACEFKVCKRCFLKNYEKPPTEESESSTFFPKCMGCMKSTFTIAYLEKIRGVRRSLYTIARRRIIESAISREKSLLPASSAVASAYTTRRIILNSLNQLCCEHTSLGCSVAIGAARGEKEFKVQRLGSLKLKVLFDGAETPSDLLVKLLDYIIEKRPDSDEGKRALMLLCSAAEAIDGNNVGLIDDVRNAVAVGHESALVEKDKVTATEAKAIYIARSTIVNNMRRFMTDLQREWWLSAKASDVALILIDCCRKNIFNAQFYDKRMIRATAEDFSTRENRRDARVRKDVHISQCTESNCRGYMYKAQRLISDCVSIQTIECKLCRSFSCGKCRVKLDDDKAGSHVCDSETAATIAEIESSTRPCPRCAIPISRTEGCRHMFCVKCNQPYDWDTLQPQISNTNPEYHSWLLKMREKVAAGEIGSDDVTALRTAFNPNARGDDGLTNDERNTMLMTIFIQTNMPTLTSIVRTISSVDSLIRMCVMLIPPPSEYEKQRIAFLMYDIDEVEWCQRVSALELSGFYYRHIAAALETFASKAIVEVKSVCARVDAECGGPETIAGKRALFNTLKTVAEFGVIASSTISSVFSLGAMNSVKSRSRSVFTSAAAYLKTLEAVEMDDGDLESSRVTPSLMNGGRSFGREGDKEVARVSRILNIVNEKMLASWVGDAIDVSP
jgi:hypothetical protein